MMLQQCSRTCGWRRRPARARRRSEQKPEPNRNLPERSRGRRSGTLGKGAEKVPTCSIIAKLLQVLYHFPRR